MEATATSASGRQPFAAEEWVEAGEAEALVEAGRWLSAWAPSSIPCGEPDGDRELEPALRLVSGLAGSMPPRWAAMAKDTPELFDGFCLATALSSWGGAHWCRRAVGPSARAALTDPATRLVVLLGTARAPLVAHGVYRVEGREGDGLRLGQGTGRSLIVELARLEGLVEAVYGPDLPAVATRADDELGRKIREAEPGATIELPAGTYRGRWTIDKPLTLRGARAETTILDGAGMGPILSLEAAGQVRLEELTLANGRGRAGGAVWIDDRSGLFAKSCLFRKNGAPDGRGGAIAVEGGDLQIEDCAFAGNLARLGGAIAIHGGARVRITQTIFTDNLALLGGGIAVGGGAELTLELVRLERGRASKDGRDLYAYSTPSGVPEVSVWASVLLRGNDPVRGLAVLGQPAAKVRLDYSAADRGALHRTQVV